MAKRVCHGPATVGGIGWHLANWQRQQGLLSDCIVYDDQGQRQLYHVKLALSERGRARCLVTMFATFVLAMVHYDIFHFYFGQTFLPLNADLPLLRLLGKKMLMTYCGSDIRLMKVEEQRNKYIGICQAQKPKERFSSDWWVALRMRWQNLWIHRFYAVRGLYEHAIEVIPPAKVETSPWLNNIGFVASVSPNPTALRTRDVPQIVHAPSNRSVKGSEFIAEAIAELRKRGLSFEYTELHGVPNTRVQEIIRDCDIVVDQLLVGGIGTLAFEGMGYGKPVVCYVPDSVIARHMPDCPVFNSNIDNLATRIEQLVRDPELRLELGARGIEFCRNHLDYESIQRAVLDLYDRL